MQWNQVYDVLRKVKLISLYIYNSFWYLETEYFGWLHLSFDILGWW